MREERNWLVKTTYPKLKAYCYSELDLDFHVVDMRWGVTDDATNDHDTERLCLREIANWSETLPWTKLCRKHSILRPINRCYIRHIKSDICT